jgi:Rha family phage regulatory protein
VYASSRDVAEFFGKSHKHVLDAVRDILQAAEISASWFVETFHEVSREGRGKVKYPCYEMTRDGFMLLAMGFTGQKATYPEV